MKPKKCGRKTQAQLNAEWDALAEQRTHQLSTRSDLSFEHVIAPLAFRLIKSVDPSYVVDLGAGTGEFTRRLAGRVDVVTAVEPSHRSVVAARKRCNGLANVRVVEQTFEAFSREQGANSVSAVVAVMSLMSVRDLSAVARAAARVVAPGGHVVAIITHPYFWPLYWRYATEPWFDYGRESFIEAPFRISSQTTNVFTTHVHRPMAQYVNAFGERGFGLEAAEEPMPTEKIAHRFPAPWRFPRFLGLRWRKVSEE